MKNLKALLDLKKVSVFLIALPYLAFNYENIIHSPFYSFTQLVLILASILLVDLFIKYGLFKLNEKLNTYLSFFIVFISILFFYGLYLTDYIEKYYLDHFHTTIRGRTIIKFCLALFIVILFLLKKKHTNFNYLNVFLILFSSISILAYIANTKTKEGKNKEFNNSFTTIPVSVRPIKPIILIISDEYTSPDGLYQVYKDSSIYKFSIELAHNGWITKNNFYSYETSTIHSLSSLFNFNLSKNKQYGKEANLNIASTKLMNASIADSLELKNVKIINFGIFSIGKHSYLNRLYFYSTSFFEDVLMQTIYYTLKSNTGSFNKSGFNNSYYPTEAHNKYIFSHLVDTLNTMNKRQSFVYAHLYMPHGPMQFNPDFQLRTQNNLINYTAYWNFTNQKLNPLLSSLIKENKYRIILAGDHGYRNDKRINPHYTFTAFYGFNKESIDQIQSVQDLGSLINGSF